MKFGYKKFEKHLDKIHSLVSASAHEKEQALWLFLSDIRTPLFMIEALCKVYKEIYDKKIFESLLNTVKSLEDSCGEIDYYVAFYKEALVNKKISEDVLSYYKKKANKSIEKLQDLLHKTEWGTADGIEEVKSKLMEVAWKSEEKDQDKIILYLKEEIQEILDFAKDIELFTDVELHVHEIRRKLRWISIYPHAFTGSIQLVDQRDHKKSIKKYLTPEVLGSKYNVFPENSDASCVITFDKKAFYALSYMIASLGKIKDDGLRVQALKTAIQATKFINDEAAYTEAYAMLGKNYPKQKDLLTEADALCKNYFMEELLISL
jgi:hypothetical protein